MGRGRKVNTEPHEVALARGIKSGQAQVAKHEQRMSSLEEHISNLVSQMEEWSDFTNDHKTQLLMRLYAGDTTANACRKLGISYGAINMYAVRNKEFAEAWKLAKEMGAHCLADELRDIHLDVALTDMQKKQASDNYKWLISRNNRAGYGQHVQVDSEVKHTMELPTWAVTGYLNPPTIDADISDS